MQPVSNNVAAGGMSPLRESQLTQTEDSSLFFGASLNSAKPKNKCQV